MSDCQHLWHILLLLTAHVSMKLMPETDDSLSLMRGIPLLLAVVIISCTDCFSKGNSYAFSLMRIVCCAGSFATAATALSLWGQDQAFDTLGACDRL